MAASTSAHIIVLKTSNTSKGAVALKESFKPYQYQDIGYTDIKTIYPKALTITRR